MIRKLIDRLNEKEGRRVLFAVLGGKVIAATLLCLGIYAASNFVGSAYADDAPALPVHVNALNTVWVLVAAFLVFFMQAGFMMLEAGFARGRETVNILLEGIVDTALCGILFWAFGFAFLFGSGNGFIGYHYFFLHGAPETYGSTGIPMLAFWLFQFAFADTCSTITSGAMVGRTGFIGDLLYSVGVSGFIYPIVGHWAWGPDGWLNNIKPAAFHDFAGSTVVHTIGGFIALAGAIALGPRLGRKFKRDGGGMPPGHDMTIAAVGGVILWFGWYGFNPGSTLSAMDLQGMSRVAANTTLAAAAGALGALFFVYPRHKIWDTGFTVNGFLAGLVAITCPCYWVSPLGAILIGAIAGVLVVVVFDFIEWLRIDDPIGAFAVHGANGIWGTLSLGLFATGQFGAPGPGGADLSGGVVKGLFYGGGLDQLKAQLIGSGAVTLATFAVALVLMYAVKATGTLRVSAEGEMMGLDLHEHGGFAYPEIMSPFGSSISSGYHDASPAPSGKPVAAAAKLTPSNS
ncbi:ammonium transporter [Anaeromyxobacter paludicola]|uniref:Ammonium transporter n=1 Tax=Anaeromyxobacter paludicola TaxID=2918171 RepID=A0ABM7XFM5_9BACT|nr:ammonium transporter [Anaeromyxobacter paludicola]BDG10678.1 ammonium transporter [Anaeromyxobacter paludicola]